MKTLLYEAPDISQYQGNVNFKALRESGCKNVFLRAGYGKNNLDQKFATNATACASLSIGVMIYWFSYAYNVAMAEKEAEYAVEHASKYWSRCPIAFDFEYDSVRYANTKGIKVTKKLATDMAIAFLKKVKALGFIPVVYYNRDYSKNYLDLHRIDAEVEGAYHWYALYSNSIPDLELAKTDIWQYTSKGRIAGVSGNVDLNKVYKDIFQCIPTKSEPTVNLYIKDFQHASNLDLYRDDSGSLLKEDGIDGPRTQQVRKKINLKAKANLFTGSTGNLVKWWQRRLNEILGIALEVDGKYGRATRLATIDFQKKFNLKVDGIAGYNTIQCAFYH